MITQDKQSSLLSRVTYPILLPGNNQNEVGKYEMLFLIDVLLYRYAALFRS